MAVFEIETPDGQKFEIDAPENVTQAEILNQLTRAGIVTPQAPVAQSQQPIPQGQAIAQRLGQQAIRGLSPIPGGVQAGQAFAQLPTGVQKAALTGAGGLIGAATPVPGGAAIGTAIGGALGELPEQVARIAPLIQQRGLRGGLAEASRQVTPRQALQFGKRRGVEAAAGLIGGGVRAITKAIKASGPLTAVIRKPSIIFKKTQQKIFNNLKSIKGKLIADSSPRDIRQARRVLLESAKRKQDFLDETVTALNSGERVSGARLMSAREVSKELTKRGGPVAENAFVGKTQITKALELRAPGYTEALKETERLLTSFGKERLSPFAQAIATGTGLGRAANIVAFPGMRRLLGASIGAAAEVFPGITGASVTLVQELLSKTR